MSENPFIKRLLLVIVIIAPVFWLVMSTEGQRLSDIFLLSLGGDPDIRLKYQALQPQVDEAQLKRDFPDIDFICEDKTTSMGDRICHSAITDVNGIPARHVTFFFAQGHLNALKLIYRRNYHQMLTEQLTAAFGAPGNAAGTTAPLSVWNMGGGSLFTVKGVLAEKDEPALLWMAAYVN